MEWDGALEWVELVGDVIPGEGLEKLRMLEDVSWGSTVEAGSRVFRIWSEKISLGRDTKRYPMREGGWFQDSMVNIGFYEFCLSPRVAKSSNKRRVKTSL